MRSKVTAIIVLILFGFGTVTAQIVLHTDFYTIENGQSPKLLISKTLKVADSNNLKKEVAAQLATWQWEGYIDARVDSIISDGQINSVFFNKGQLYKWLYLYASDSAYMWLKEAGYGGDDLEGGPIYMKYVTKVYLAVLHTLENKGYPFASIQIDSISFTRDQRATGHISLHTGPQIIIDSIRVTGGAHISKQYLEAYLKIKEGDVYNESLLAAAVQRLKELPFIDMVKPPAVIFYGNRARLILSLKNRNASRADVLLALGRSNDISQRLTLTGEGHLAFVNSLQHGEAINLDFNKLQPLTSGASIGGAYPYVFNRPYGIDAHLELFKQDSNFLNVTHQYGFQYFKEARQYIKVYVKIFSSSLLTIDTNSIISSHTLPAQLDVHATSYGFQFNIVTTDFKLNPSKGWEINIDVAVSLRTVEKNNKILGLRDPIDTAFKFNTLYNGIKLQSTYYSINGYLRRYFSLGKLNIIKMALTGAAISNPNIGLNEMYRVGGLSSIRGFAEQSFYSTAYMYSTLEYRLRLGELSYMFLFYDKAVLKSISGANAHVINPYSLGVGITFATKAGLFTLSYASGNIPPAAINVKNAKVQFGYTGYF